ncbi:MAG: hypothetical protein A3K65_05620 [Euryarchaeota archaeon RBG_16_68_12]|nr:MAG: hypothetical protein A3K65_05620 [Euryarchaeota archaeon RBG_16_68_12]
MAPRRFLAVVLVAAALALVLPPARAADATPPWGVSWGPQGPSVPVDTAIQVVWSERMNWTTVESAFSYTDGNLTYTAGAWTIDDPTNSSAFVPATALQHGTRYTLHFASTAADAAGNRLDQDRDGIGGEACSPLPPFAGDCLVWQFDTAPPPPDTTPPRVLSTSPAGGATAPPDAAIEVRFSEGMDTASAQAAFSYGDGFSLYTVGDGTATWASTSAPDDTLRFVPRLEFASGGRVTVNLDGRVARDAAGNLLDGDGNGTGGDSYSWSFAVAGDPAPPRVLTASPPAGAGSVPISATVRLVFSKALARGAVAASLSLRGPGAPTLTAANGSVAWSGTRFPDDTLVFDPYPNLETATAYVFALNGSVAADREGLRLDGDADGAGGDDYRLNFTTEAQDLTPPSVARTDPAAGAMDVVATSAIGIWFSEPMNRSSVEGAFSYTDGASTWRTADGARTWSNASDTLTFQPAQALAYGMRYTVTIGGLARDEAGNPLNGGADEAWTFTTASQLDTTAPWIKSKSPLEGQKNVSRTARVSIIFSEAMDKAAVQAAVGITNGAVLTDFRWPNDATFEAATAAPMEYRTPYVVFVLTGARDLAGNPMTQPVQIPFTTESWRGRVSGRVADERYAPVAGARVELGRFVMLADAGGNFGFEPVEQGTYVITVSGPGFEAYTASVEIGPGRADLGTIVLHPPAAPLDVTLWAGLGTVLFSVVLVAVILRRLRSRPTEHYETWKPAKVVTVEPGLPPRDKP